MIMAYRLVKTLVAAIAATGFAIGAAQAAGGSGKELKSPGWSHSGPFGTYDRASVQRGLQVYNEVCAACHGLKYVAFRNLMEIGFSEAQAKAIAAEKTVEDGPNDDGEMFERSAKLADRFLIRSRTPRPRPPVSASHRRTLSYVQGAWSRG